MESVGSQAAFLVLTSPPLKCDPPFYRYEDEINKRTAAENEFVTLKKVS
jgi:hypothetical protein